jgi:hypothetical protein
MDGEYEKGANNGTKFTLSERSRTIDRTFQHPPYPSRSQQLCFEVVYWKLLWGYKWWQLPILRHKTLHQGFPTAQLVELRYTLSRQASLESYHFFFTPSPSALILARQNGRLNLSSKSLKFLSSGREI